MEYMSTPRRCVILLCATAAAATNHRRLAQLPSPSARQETNIPLERCRCSAAFGSRLQARRWQVERVIGAARMEDVAVGLFSFRGSNTWRGGRPDEVTAASLASLDAVTAGTATEGQRYMMFCPESDGVVGDAVSWAPSGVPAIDHLVNCPAAWRSEKHIRQHGEAASARNGQPETCFTVRAEQARLALLDHLASFIHPQVNPTWAMIIETDMLWLTHPLAIFDANRTFVDSSNGNAVPASACDMTFTLTGQGRAPGQVSFTLSVNTGVMLLRNTPAVRAFFSRVVTETQLHVASIGCAGGQNQHALAKLLHGVRAAVHRNGLTTPVGDVGVNGKPSASPPFYLVNDSLLNVGTSMIVAPEGIRACAVHMEEKISVRQGVGSCPAQIEEREPTRFADLALLHYKSAQRDAVRAAVEMLQAYDCLTAGALASNMSHAAQERRMQGRMERGVQKGAPHHSTREDRGGGDGMIPKGGLGKEAAARDRMWDMWAWSHGLF